MIGCCSPVTASHFAGLFSPLLLFQHVILILIDDKCNREYQNMILYHVRSLSKLYMSNLQHGTDQNHDSCGKMNQCARDPVIMPFFVDKLIVPTEAFRTTRQHLTSQIKVQPVYQDRDYVSEGDLKK